MAEELTTEDLIGIYRSTRVIAVVGASNTEGKPAHDIPAYLQQMGYRIIPVNPREETVLGERAFPSLRDLPEKPDVIDVFRPAEEAEDVARDAIATGTPVLWFQPGTDTDEAIRIAREGGMTVVAHRCMGATHERLGLGPVDSYE